MGAKINTATAMDTDIHSPVMILKNGINGAGGNTLATVDAEFFLYPYSAALTLGKGTSGTGYGAGGRVAGQTVISLESSSHAPG